MTHQSAPHDAAPVAHTIPEAARIAGVSVRTLRYAIERGEIDVRYPTSRPVILRDDVLAWLATAPTVRAAATGRPAGAVAS